MIYNILKVFRALTKNETIVSLNKVIKTEYPPTKFLSNKRNRIKVKCFLCGFPRSGTHWIRNVIEKSSGKKTFNLFEERPTENDSEVLLIKIHARNKIIAKLKALWILPSFDFENKYIYVYRDPRDAIISMYEMYRHYKQKENISISVFLDTIDPIKQYKWEVSSWIFNENKNIYKVKYENLKQNPTVEFPKIFQFLNLNCNVDIKSLERKLATADSKNRPRATAYGWKNASSKYLPIIKKVTKELYKEIKYLGYDI